MIQSSSASQTTFSFATFVLPAAFDVEWVGEYTAKQRLACAAMTSLSLYPAEPSPRLIGIAKLASQAEQVDSGHQVEFFSLPVRSILNRCDSRRNLPFTWTIN